MTITQDLQVEAGIPNTFTIPLGQDADGWVAHLQIRDVPSGLVFADLDVGTGLTIDTVDDTCDVALTTALTLLLGAVGTYDLLAGPDTSHLERIAQGAVYVSPPVTR